MSRKDLYLKYRPFQLDDIVGQPHLVATLKQSVKNNEFSHAYLFSGNYGCGKTSTSRILANLMTCENIVDGKLCGKCRACQTIHNSSAIDVKELDGASNRGIDDIRALIDAAQWSPQELKRKIYIIDEAHQLGKEAISALLKTLEEPPDYLTFILCTTESKKILPTIMSRCAQRFNLNKIPSKIITDRIEYISKQENMNIDRDALEVMAKMARGSMRDAIGYLEQISTVASDKKIDKDKTQKYFGSVDRTGIYEIVKTIINGNVSLLMDQINDLLVASVDIKQVLFEITEVFRNAMLLKAQEGKVHLIDLPDTEINELKKISQTLTLNQLLKLSHVFNVEKKVEFNINDRWIMEATLINCVATIRQNQVAI